MKRTKKAVHVQVRKYGLRDPAVFDDEAEYILVKQNDYWNKLVEIERENTRLYNELCRQIDPEIGILSDQIDSKRAQLSELFDAKRAAAKAAKKRVPTPEVDEQTDVCLYIHRKLERLFEEVGRL